MQAQFFEYWWKSVLCSWSLPGTEGSGISQWLLLLVAEQFSAQPSPLFTSSVNCQCSLRFLCLLVHEGTHCVSVASFLKGIQWCIKCCLPCSSRTVFTYKPVVCFHWQKDKAYRNTFNWSHLCLDGPWGWRNLSSAATSPAPQGCPARRRSTSGRCSGLCSCSSGCRVPAGPGGLLCNYSSSGLVQENLSFLNVI